jgi:hypothetical protein
VLNILDKENKQLTPSARMNAIIKALNYDSSQARYLLTIAYKGALVDKQVLTVSHG